MTASRRVEEGSMYKSIVVGTDGSATATEAVCHAADLAALTGARLHIVHAFRVASAPDVAAQDARAVLASAAESAKREGVTVETHPLVGDAATALIDAATREDADLLVVGNKGMSGARRFILGSVPNTISHRMPCNLLIVHTSS